MIRLHHPIAVTLEEYYSYYNCYLPPMTKCGSSSSSPLLPAPPISSSDSSSPLALPTSPLAPPSPLDAPSFDEDVFFSNLRCFRFNLHTIDHVTITLTLCRILIACYNLMYWGAQLTWDLNTKFAFEQNLVHQNLNSNFRLINLSHTVASFSPLGSFLRCLLLSSLPVGGKLLLKLSVLVVPLCRLRDPLLAYVLTPSQVTVHVEHLTTSTGTRACTCREN